MSLDILTDPQTWASLLTLTVMEIVLGIDNLVFVALAAGRLPPERQRSGRRVGLALALVTRIGLLTTISLIMGLTAPLLVVFGQSLSWRDLVLIGGGAFLVYKGTGEIHHRIEGEDETPASPARGATFAGTVIQIALLDIVFSIDSVITAVGMASHLPVMIAAIVLAMGLMVVASEVVAGFIARYPTVKMLVLSFLLLVGMVLVADGFGAHVPKGFIYAAMGFSAAVETLNQIAARRRRARIARLPLAGAVSGRAAPPPQRHT